MKLVTMLTTSLLLLSAVTAVHGESRTEPTAAPEIIWGKAIRGVQLGISRLSESVSISDELSFRVHLRSVSMSPVRLLASVHGCLAVGSGAAILVSKLELESDAGGDPLIVTYRGPNHAIGLDRPRDSSESQQKNRETDGTIEFGPEDAEYLTTILEPSETTPGEPVEIAWGKDTKARWALANETKALPAGKYKVTAVFTVDQKLSEWKGEVRSGTLEVSITLGAQAAEKTPQNQQFELQR